MGIKTKLENGKLIIFPEGRIDTTNAMEIEKEMFGLAYEHENTPIEVDAEKLEYISSSGLRVLMKLLRMKKDKIIIRNVSSDVYKIFEVTGFTELFHIRKDRTLSRCILQLQSGLRMPGSYVRFLSKSDSTSAQ